MKFNVTAKNLVNLPNRQVDPWTKYSPVIAGNAYKFGVTIETLDGANGSTPKSVFDKWNCKVVISQYPYGDQTMQIQIMIPSNSTTRYDSAIIDGSCVMH